MSGNQSTQNHQRAQHGRQRLDPAMMSDLELAQYANSLPIAAGKHKAAMLTGGCQTTASRRLQSTLHLLGRVRNEIDQRAGRRGTITLIDQRSGEQKISPFEAFTSVAKSVLPDDLYERIAREANGLLGDEATPEECSVLRNVRARSVA